MMKEICLQSRRRREVARKQQGECHRLADADQLELRAQTLIRRFDQMSQHYERHHSMESS
jgi:hypothetical protein